MPASPLPAVTHGLQVGDVGSGRALVWARCDEPARLVVEWDTSERFASPRVVRGPVVGPARGLAATVALSGLPDGQTIFVRGRFEREAARGTSATATARFQTPRADRFRVAWTGDTCGQGYGRNPEFGGLVGYPAMRDAGPGAVRSLRRHDLRRQSDLRPSSLVADRVWRNVTNERVARVAQTLDDFRARYQYSLDDDHVRALAGEVPIVAQWDDHEIHNNWWPHQQSSSRTPATRSRAMPACSRAMRAGRCSNGRRLLRVWSSA